MNGRRTRFVVCIDAREYAEVDLDVGKVYRALPTEKSARDQGLVRVIDNRSVRDPLERLAALRGLDALGAVVDRAALEPLLPDPLLRDIEINLEFRDRVSVEIKKQSYVHSYPAAVRFVD